MAGFTQGALFRRIDLQVHTPRDPHWAGPPVLGIEKLSEQEVIAAREQWAKSFVDACLERNLGAIAITDHHDWEFARCVLKEVSNRRAQNPQFDFWVYPGLEVSCKDSAQCLIIFDADTPIELLDNKLPGLLGLPVDRKPLARTHPKVELLDIDVSELQYKLEADPEIRGRFIILPNLSPDGHKTLLRTGFHKRYASLPYIGGYLDRKKPSSLKERDRRILAGEDPEWGSKRMPVVYTSDARSFEMLGENTPWIKVGDRTAEALRQAFLAPESRLSEDKPDLPSAYVSRIRVSGAKVLTDLALPLNPQLVALIGGRGSGKSTLLEYIRFALGHGPEDMDSSGNHTSRRRDLIDDTLLACKGSVEVEVVIDGSVSVFRRSGENPGVIEQVIGDQVLPLHPSAVRNIFPIQPYSQGELSSLGERDAGDRVRHVLLSPRKTEVSVLEDQIANMKAQLRSLVERLVLGWKTQLTYEETKAKLANLREQLSSILDTLKQAPSTQANVADQYSRVTSISNQLAQNVRQLESGLKWLSSAPTLKLKQETVQAITSNLSDLPEFHAIATEIIKMVQDSELAYKSTIEALSQKLRDAYAQCEVLMQRWETLREGLETQYQIAAAQASEFQKTLQRRNELENEISQTEQYLAQLGEQLSTLDSVEQEFAETRKSLNSLRAQMYAILSHAASQFETLSGGLARASVVIGHKQDAVYNALQRLVQGTGTRADRLDKLMDWIQGQTDPHLTWQQVQDEVLSYLRWKVTGADVNKRPECTIIFEFLSERALSRIDSQRTAELVSSFLEDTVELEYIRGNQVVPFSTASPGEQAAALLAVLLSQSGGPLILDQPEDDLDNKIVTEIVELVQQAKKRRQIIMATHNANLVVNGDAEQVLYFEPIEAQSGKSCTIRDAGTIDVPSIKEAITTTMEGGKAAFELRRIKYHF